MSAGLASAIYCGTVAHTRFEPKRHAFRYPLFMVYLDLDELDRVFSLSRWWRREKWAPATFRRSDYLGDAQTPLAEAVRRKATAETGQDYPGPVRLLAHLRYFGHCFNPVTFYYLHDADGALGCIIAEITNTPWNERHAYVLPVQEPTAESHEFGMEKAFHVSPFMPMEQQYAWRFAAPGNEQLQVYMENFADGKRQFVANLAMERREMTPKNMRKLLFSYPFMTMKVVVGIYWQAALLKLKGCRFYPHPDSVAGDKPAGL